MWLLLFLLCLQVVGREEGLFAVFGGRGLPVWLLFFSRPGKGETLALFCAFRRAGLAAKKLCRRGSCFYLVSFGVPRSWEVVWLVFASGRWSLQAGNSGLFSGLPAAAGKQWPLFVAGPVARRGLCVFPSS